MKLLVRAASAALLLSLAACATTPGPVRVVQPVAPEARGQVSYSEIEIKVSDTAKANVARLDAKAAEKRVSAKLAPVNGALAQRPTKDQYETLPLELLLRHSIEDALSARNVPGGRPLKLTVTVDNLKTANAAAAWLAASSDQLAGLVTVSDAATGQRLGSFYIDVTEAHAGLLGMAMRGSEVREKMAAQFAEHVRNNL